MTGRGIYYMTTERNSIAFYDFVTKKPKTILLLRRPVALQLGLTVSPDERWLLYSQMDQFDSDLMLAENFR